MCTHQKKLFQAIVGAFWSCHIKEIVVVHTLGKDFEPRLSETLQNCDIFRYFVNLWKPNYVPYVCQTEYIFTP